MREDGGWRALAACGNKDPERFFPAGRPSNEAKSPCGDCQVRETCLETALASPWEPYGIWAGMSPKELRPLWRQRHPGWTHTEVLDLIGLG